MKERLVAVAKRRCCCCRRIRASTKEGKTDERDENSQSRGGDCGTRPRLRQPQMTTRAGYYKVRYALFKPLHSELSDTRD